jgi:hypothetical protein
MSASKSISRRYIRQSNSPVCAALREEDLLITDDNQYQTIRFRLMSCIHTTQFSPCCLFCREGAAKATARRAVKTATTRMVDVDR